MNLEYMGEVLKLSTITMYIFPVTDYKHNERVPETFWLLHPLLSPSLWDAPLTI